MISFKSHAQNHTEWHEHTHSTSQQQTRTRNKKYSNRKTESLEDATNTQRNPTAVHPTNMSLSLGQETTTKLHHHFMHGPQMTVEFIKRVVTRNHNQGFSYSKKSKTIPNGVMVGMQMNRMTLQSTHQAP